jgi:hypothetical protein
MPQVFRYFIEFNCAPGPEGWIGGPPTAYRRKHERDRFVWPKLFETREAAERHIYELDARNPDKERQRYRGLFANAERGDGGFMGRKVRGASVQYVRIS